MKKTIVSIESKVQWQVARSATSGRWIGVCQPMNLAMEANSLDELSEVIKESIHLLLIDLLQDNELDQFLRDRGWTALNMPRCDVTGDVEFDVPLELLVAESSRGPEYRPH
jgi:hypothetical protein